MTENGYNVSAMPTDSAKFSLSPTSRLKQLDKLQLHIDSGLTMPWSLLGRTTDKVSVEFRSSRIYTLYQSDIWKNVGVTWAIVWFCTFLFLRSVIFTSRRFFKGKYPPGPTALPFVGNLFQLSVDAWVPFTKWKSIYGPVVYLNVAGQPVIVLNTHRAAADLLDRRANIYSDRPTNIVAGFLTGGFHIAFMPHGDMWRRMRRAASDALSHADSYHRIQMIEAVLLTDGLLQTASSWDSHMRRATASMIMTLIYDTPVLKNANDPSAVPLNNFVDQLSRAAYPGAYLVEFFTWMRYLPSWMAKWKYEAVTRYRKYSTIFSKSYGDVCQRVADGDERPSFASSLAKNGHKYGLDFKESAWLTGALFAAGSDTTATALSWFLLAMVVFPDVQKKAQAELDEVVGRGKLPTFADYDHLPYIRALVKETMRWRPAGPVGIPHCIIQDDTYEGYHIPKGTICIPNVWAMNSDPDIYGADVNEFNPSRHLDSEGKIKPAIVDTKEESHVTYGFGRRLCPGRHIANNSLFIDIATILWTLTIEPARDDKGEHIMPDIEGNANASVLLKPLPFDCVTKPRFMDADVILTQSKEDMGYEHLVWN